MGYTQQDRPFKVSSPLPFDTLLFYRMTGEEELARAFRYELELLSEDDAISMDDLLGNPMQVSVQCPSQGQERYFHGLVSRFGLVGYVNRLALYRAELRPWLWFLNRTADCRIFQDQNVPDIAAQIFRENGFSDFENLCSGSYVPRGYCVQYRESDFDFVSRLFEQEGIYYYFTHQAGKHTLVMADSVTGHQRCAIEGAIPYLNRRSAGGAPEQEYVDDWQVERVVRPGTYVHTDFDFTKPRADLTGSGAVSRPHGLADFEVFDYPALTDEHDQSDTYARTRIEELQVSYEEAMGTTNCRAFTAGCLFQLDGFPRSDQNREHLLKAITYRLDSDDYQTTDNAPPRGFEARFRALSSQEPFRPARITPKPVVKGPQTAIVVGQQGEEIWTDQYGRVKVQFHWDRYGKRDENSSCWVRVSQAWAGKTWGGIQIPRIGQEVIVDFLEGDPDRPIITGRVYNNDQMPPYGLPANMTQSGVKSRSTKGGSGDNFNEIRFEDKKGAEQVYIHAEKNQDNVVENDETTQVGHDRTENVGNDETITIGHNRTETVGNNETISIGNNRTESVGKDESISIGNNRTESVGKDESITIGKTRTEAVGADESVTIAKNRTHSIGANDTLSVKTDQKIDIGSNLTESVGKDYSENVGKNLKITAGDSIVIQTGKASITMKKDGTITIQGKDITVKGSGGINVKASKDVVIKGKKILEN